MAEDTGAHNHDVPRDRGGYELASKALEEARAAARAAGKSVGQGRASPTRRRRAGGSRRSWSGAGPDARDPQPLGRLAAQISANRGWQADIGKGMVFGMWDTIVGPDIAAHAQPTLLRDKVLHVQAESTAWATQLRYIQAQVLAKIAAGAGHGLVTSLRITGPTAPSWKKGPRSVPGRGPRDTYG
ncbi:DUF721 family protein [Gordonia pseudamarae]|uniref:UPF0232 protein GII31_00020 n=1 Tax=Gordonia pseudamarae TaxID=2831662 RepID=A0ABX6IEH7_9ACTN|nr:MULTISPECIES: DUF721 family protein [Gordonia]MBD0024210.1 DUF721 family protein [Gordonia sp. (in: high G+C Gram-positive bacteria)]QHN24605.1 DUF721 family protein [Gordonia pseudamarae]QHN33536.1 DUF721 family protein [Gordonia pseudamarae]